MATGGFTNEEIAYLRSLPAVSRVTNGRIRYSDDFRRECMRRYWEGESPVRIFRDAGLDVSLIGYKRIERCIARWREFDASGAADAAESAGGRGGVEDVRAAAGRPRGPMPEPFTPGLRVRDGKRDLRDLLISQQVLLIEKLESEVAMLRAEIGRDASQRRDGGARRC